MPRRTPPDGGMSKKKQTKLYEKALVRLQTAMVETQARVIEQGRRVLIVFEGRDTAGKDGSIKRMTEYMAPRLTHVVALPKPTDRERGQWYFQRYVPHLPAAGEFAILNRSWYNRAGVEPVMGFCTPEQHERFLHDAPRFERMLTDDGIELIKLWLDISRDEQAGRLEDRRADPLRHFKISALDDEAQKRWAEYSRARDRMLAETHTLHGPWTVIATDDKKTARLNILRHVLNRLGAEVEAPDAAVAFPADQAAGRLAP